jgi:1,2-diacylglycerol 3-beta-galactosyltransferase
MESNGATPKRVLFLFSDTGGGHRAATNAMIEALNLEYPGRFDCKMVDFFREYYPAPWRYAPEIYPPMAKVGAWKLAYRSLDGRGRARAMNGVQYPYLRHGIRRMLAENPNDLIVSVHPLVNSTLPRAMRKHPSPFITVVTDMVSAHAFWYDRHADLILVPTDVAKERGIHFGIPAGNLRVVGQPVDVRFADETVDREQWRIEQGWDLRLPTALLIGGGDGMGPLKRVAKAINEAGLPLQLVVICGRNEDLKADLEAIEWEIPAHIYGFTTQMPQFMAGSDILITKAGPGTISEGFIKGLPLILYSRVGGQEDGNVDYVVDNHAGVWAHRPREVVDTLREWVENPELMRKIAATSLSLARPDASRKIARIIAEQTGVA